MKRITCEICGSNDLMKENGCFVCQSCGCKYSMEEVRKMMIEGTVEVQGTVQIDNSSYVKKYLENARRAKEKEDWEETEKYYNMVEQNDPSNIEAIFYSAYGKAMTSLVDDDIYKRKAVFKVLRNSISIIDDKYDSSRLEENEKAIMAMAIDLGKMINSTFVYTEWKNGYGFVTRTNKNDTYQLFGELIDSFRESIDNIQKKDDQLFLHQAAIRLYGVARETGIGNWHSLMSGWIEEEKKAIEKLKLKYWDTHREEYLALMAEKNKLDVERAKYVSKITELMSVDTVSDVEARIKELRREKEMTEEKKAMCGIFDGKAKKEYQERIDTLNYEIYKLNLEKDNRQRMAQNRNNIEIEKQRAELTKVLAEIKKIDEKLMRK